MAETSTERRRRGTWETDGPSGYVSMVVYGSDGRTMALVQVAERDFYPDDWVPRLREWLDENDRPLALVR